MQATFIRKTGSGILTMLTLLLTFITTANSQGLLREYWSDISGTLVTNLTDNTNYPNNPTSRNTITIFEGPSNTADNYGTRIRGYVVPPTTGNYTFWISSDDNSQLWLSTSDDPAGKTLIASVSGWTNPREWTKFSSQQSTQVALTAGQRYYVEVLHKEGTGGDNVAVGWQGPGISGDAERPIPGSRLQPYRIGLLREVWNDIPGSAVTDLTSNANYPNSPSSSGQIYSFEAPIDVAEDYGARIRGYIVPPTTGSYTFWIASDDNSELWLSTDANPAGKALIASVPEYTNSREWTKYSSQQSTARTLTAGQKYYVEVLFKEGYGGDNCAVGWQGPGISGDVERPIPASRLLPWTGSSTPTYSLTINNDGHGTTSPSGTITVDSSAQTAIAATSATGYVFSGWSVVSGSASIANPSAAATTVALENGNATIRANFTALSYILTVNSNGNGTTVPTGNVIVNHGVATSISAAPAGGYQFTGWSVTSGSASIANPSSPSTSVTLSSGTATVTANFSLLTYSLNVTNDGNGTTTPSGIVTVNHGAATAINAIPATGYLFTGWTVTSGTASIANPSSAATTITLTSGNASIRASFSAQAYILTVSDDGNGTTVPTGPVSVAHGAATTIAATPATGFQFTGWTVTSGTASITNPSSATTTVTLTSGNASIQADFSVQTYTLTMTSDSNGTTTPSGIVQVDHGIATAISATPASGYNFLNWTITAGTATIAAPSSATTTVTMTSGNATLRANFTQQLDLLTIANNGNGTTSPSGDIEVGRGVATTISATANSGYHFVSWTIVSGTPQIANPTSATTTVTTSGDAEVRADFDANQPSLPNNRQIAITGELFDDNGDPVGTPTPDTIEMQVQLWNQATGGTSLYTESYLIANGQEITVVDGRFVVRLGSGATSGDLTGVLSANENLFAEITVLGVTPDVLLPRTPVTAAPYAHSVPAATVQNTTLHGTGTPLDSNLQAPIGTYYVDDATELTWVKLNLGWKIVD